MDDFLLAWCRFVSRRSTPRRVRSDNGTAFVAAAKVLRIHWIFNPAAPPWFGGFYERLVRVVKTPLKNVLGKALLRPAEIGTVLCEIEQAVNKHPLTHVGARLEKQPLTPAKLIGMNIGQLKCSCPTTTCHRASTDASHALRSDSCRSSAEEMETRVLCHAQCASFRPLAASPVWRCCVCHRWWKDTVLVDGQSRSTFTRKRWKTSCRNDRHGRCHNASAYQEARANGSGFEAGRRRWLNGQSSSPNSATTCS